MDYTEVIEKILNSKEDPDIPTKKQSDKEFKEDMEDLAEQIRQKSEAWNKKHPELNPPNKFRNTPLDYTLGEWIEEIRECEKRNIGKPVISISENELKISDTPMPRLKVIHD